MKVLPKKPSKLLKIALKDMKKTIASGYNIQMENWGENIGKRNCTVCFAGSVMLNTLKLKPVNHEFDSAQFGKNNAQLRALDSIRKGDLHSFLLYLGSYKEFEEAKFMKSYYRDSIGGWVNYKDCKSDKQFYKQIKEVIKFLKSKKL